MPIFTKSIEEANPAETDLTPFPARVYVDLSRVDWNLLRRQKRVLLGLAASAGKFMTRRERETIHGIIHLVDHIQDEAASTLSEKTIFGRSST